MPEQEQAPQENPLDTQAQEQELKSLVEELTQANASLESDFAKYAAENLSAEDEEMFFDDKEAFITKILQMQNAFFDERIRSKEGRIKELEGDIQNKKNLGLIEEAEQKFLNETKTSPQEFQKMMEFVDSDLPPRVMRELEKLEPYEFFLKVKELYDAQKPKEKAPPVHLSGGAGSSGVGGDESPMNRI